MDKALLALAAAGLLLGGCGDLQRRLGPGEIELHQAAWKDSEIVPQPEAIYCYRTLGRQDCYRRPQEGEGRRLIEHYGPLPALVSGS